MFILFITLTFIYYEEKLYEDYQSSKFKHQVYVSNIYLLKPGCHIDEASY